MAIPSKVKKNEQNKSKYDLTTAKSMFMDFKPLKEIAKVLNIK